MEHLDAGVPRGKGLTDPDLQIAQAVDPGMGTDPNASTSSFTPTGRRRHLPDRLRDAIIAGWKADTPSSSMSRGDIDGEAVTKGDFGTKYEASYWYVTETSSYDIQTTDESLAARPIEAIPKAGASSAPAPSGSGAATVALPVAGRVRVAAAPFPS